jgi:hypothetical protein
VTNMEYMFAVDTSFTGNLTTWSVNNVIQCTDFCGVDGTICGVPSFITSPFCFLRGKCSSATIQPLSGGPAVCSCPAGEVGRPRVDAQCRLGTTSPITSPKPPTGSPTVTTKTPTGTLNVCLYGCVKPMCVCVCECASDCTHDCI